MRVAAAQLPGTRLTDWRQALDQIGAAIRAAAAERAELVVLPECAWPAYVLGSAAEFDAALAAGMPPSGWFLEWLSQRARESQIAVCCGFVEQLGDGLRNSAALVDAGGALLGIRSKHFLWDFDRDYFCAGDDLSPISAPWGRVGIFICADGRLPEVAATLAARGARLLLQPTAWVNAGTPERPSNPQAEFMIAARAREFALPIVSASKFGVERQTHFVGMSLICDGGGKVLARAGSDRQEVITANVTLPEAGCVVVSPEEAEMLSAPHQPPATDAGEFLIATPGAATEARRNEPLGRLLASAPVLWLGPPASGECTRATHALTITPGERQAADFGRVRYVRLGPADVERFAPGRIASAAGAHLLVVIGTSDPLWRQTRAAENRVFVVQYSGDDAELHDPRGILQPPEMKVLAQDGERVAAVWRVDAGRAADKCAARGTDVLAGRLLRCYQYTLT